MCLGGPLNGQEKLKIKITGYCSAFKDNLFLYIKQNNILYCQFYSARRYGYSEH